MTNAFIILLIVTAIYAVLGTHLYKLESPQYFGFFSRSLFTMMQVVPDDSGSACTVCMYTHDFTIHHEAGRLGFGVRGLRIILHSTTMQVVTGDSWASAITRSLYPLEGPPNHSMNFFFVSYVLIGGTVLLNVVLTVLLDEFLKAVQLEKEQKQEELEAELEACRVHGVLDPLIESLRSFTDNNDLKAKIASTFDTIDEDKSGGLNYEEFSHAIGKLPLPAPIHITRDDFDCITDGGHFLNDDDEFGADEFQNMMRGELLRYAQRQVSFAMQEAEGKEMRATMLLLKVMETTLSSTAAKVNAPDTHHVSPVYTIPTSAVLLCTLCLSA